jgi:hypothetical protein
MGAMGALGTVCRFGFQSILRVIGESGEIGSFQGYLALF